MTYHLWLGNVDCGVAIDEAATAWRDTMRADGYEDARIEPEPGTIATFSFVENENEALNDRLPAVAVRCPECQVLTSYPGLDAMLAFTCPHCGATTTVNPTVQ